MRKKALTSAALSGSSFARVTSAVAGAVALAASVISIFRPELRCGDTFPWRTSSFVGAVIVVSG